MKLSNYNMDILSDIQVIMTEEEKIVLKMILSGCSRQQIANRLHCDVRTVDRRIANIKLKYTEGVRKMQNNVNALNNILFEQIEIINDIENNAEELEYALKKARAIEGLAGKIISCAALAVNAKKIIENEDNTEKVDITFLGIKNDVF